MTRFCLSFHVRCNNQSLFRRLKTSSLLYNSYKFNTSTHVFPACLAILSRPSAQSPATCSSRDVANGSLHPQLGILSVQELDVERHGLAGSLAESLVKDTLELELSNALVLQDLCSHLKQPVAGSDLHLARRVSAANNDRLGRLGEHLEVVGDLCANRVFRVQESLGVPHLRLRVGIAVLLLEVLALVCIA
jgi:hypothetical protein